MKNHSKVKEEVNQKSDKPQYEIQLDLYIKKMIQIVIDEGMEKNLNSMILKITMRIKDEYPELSKYIEEMPVTIPDEKNPQVTLKTLKEYYDSLNSLLNKYVLEHPIN